MWEKPALVVIETFVSKQHTEHLYRAEQLSAGFPVFSWWSWSHWGTGWGAPTSPQGPPVCALSHHGIQDHGSGSTGSDAAIILSCPLKASGCNNYTLGRVPSEQLTRRKFWCLQGLARSHALMTNKVTTQQHLKYLKNQYISRITAMSTFGFTEPHGNIGISNVTYAFSYSYILRNLIFFW